MFCKLYYNNFNINFKEDIVCFNIQIYCLCKLVLKNNLFGKNFFKIILDIEIFYVVFFSFFFILKKGMLRKMIIVVRKSLN